MPTLVPCQLLPHGLKRSPSCHELWRTEGGYLDDWLGPPCCILGCFHHAVARYLLALVVSCDNQTFILNQEKRRVPKIFMLSMSPSATLRVKIESQPLMALAMVIQVRPSIWHAHHT